MREILFRGKRIDNVKWVEGCLDFNDTTTLTFIRTPRHIYTDVEMVDPKTVGQYTGLNDKNGQKIFEGDFIRAVLPASKAQREFTWPVMPVVYSRGAFGLEDSHGEITPLRSFAPYVTFEIVGNIHDSTQKEEPK